MLILSGGEFQDNGSWKTLELQLLLRYVSVTRALPEWQYSVALVAMEATQWSWQDTSTVITQLMSSLLEVPSEFLRSKRIGIGQFSKDFQTFPAKSFEI